MLSLVLAESSLELVPFELQRHPSVVSHARRLNKHPSEILLDNSWHFAAMKKIKDELKRGRPDIVHFSILEATTIPLYLQNKMKFFVHTIDDKVISFSNNVRIPKSYHRFEHLMEKLYQEKRIVSDHGSNPDDPNVLLEIKEQTFAELVDEISPSKIIGLSTRGRSSTCEKIAADLSDSMCIVLGGFQKGHFSDSVTHQINDLCSIDAESLESHVVVARILYEYEKTIFM